MGVQTCPSDSAIEQLADGLGSEELSHHVDACQPCRARLEEARRDATFLRKIGTVVGGMLAPLGAPRLPGYQVQGIINSGAQGVVYKGVQESTSRPVAIKALAAAEGASPRQRARAEREAEIVARLHHPNIVTVFESRSLADGRIAVVMEFIDGVPIDAWKPPGDTPEQRRLSLLRAFMQVCAGVHHAHLNGVIHRDLKPDNILVTADGRPVVVDFGIAKAGGGLHTTLTGEFAGTPAYASPEQAQGRPDTVDALTDVYSLGVILYKLLCGSLPYRLEGSIFEMARTIGEAQPAPLTTRDATISDDLDAIVTRALRKEKELRYQSAASLARDLERFLKGDPVDARSGSGWYLLQKAVHVNRKRLAWAALAAGLALVAVAAVLWSLGNVAAARRREDSQKALTRAERVRARAVTEVLREVMPTADPQRPELADIVGAGLDRLYVRLETGAFAADPEVDQAVRRLWGEVYTGLGSGKAADRVQFAEVSLRNGLIGLRQQYGGEHPQIAATMHELAAVLLVRKRLPEARDLCIKALRMRMRLVGSSSIEVADSHALLSKIYMALNRPGEALDNARLALATYRDIPDHDADAPVGALLAMEAHVWIAQSPQMAEAPLREALVRQLRALPPEDPDLAASLADAARLCELLPASTLAADLAAVWGAHNPVAALRADLPRLTAPDRPRAPDALASGRPQALARLAAFQARMLGPDDPAQVRTLMAQSLAALAQGDHAQRADAALAAADVLERHLGPADRSVLMCVELAAVVLAHNGQAERAIEVGERALRIREQTPEHLRDPILEGGALRYQAFYLTLAGRYEQAAPYWRRARDAMLPVTGRNHHAIALIDAGLSLCMPMPEQLAEADRLTARAMTIADASPAIAPDQRAAVHLARARVLIRQGEHEQALRLLAQAWNEWIYKAMPRFEWRRLALADARQAATALGRDDLLTAWDDAAESNSPTAPMP